MSVESLLLQNILEKYSHLPMAEERRSFLAYKLEAGSSWSTLRQIAIYMAAAVDRMNLAPDTKLSPEQIECAAQAWANRRRRTVNLICPERVAQRFRFIVTTWFSFLGRLNLAQHPPNPTDAVLADFAHFLEEARGLAPATIKNDCNAARLFLQSHPLAQIENHNGGINAIQNHVTELKARGYSRTWMAEHIQRLRTFFRYAEERGKLPTGLSHGLAARVYIKTSGFPLAHRGVTYNFSSKMRTPINLSISVTGL